MYTNRFLQFFDLSRVLEKLCMLGPDKLFFPSSRLPLSTVLKMVLFRYPFSLSQPPQFPEQTKYFL